MNDEKFKMFADLVKDSYSPSRVAFAPALAGVGVVIEGESGYFPVPDYIYSSEDFMANADEADRLNKEILNLPEGEALKIISSSMKGV